MVVEFLTFRVPLPRQQVWLVADRDHWTQFLRTQPGFVRKEVWRATDDDEMLHAVIWWESEAQWQSIPQDELDAVATAMGGHVTARDMHAFDVVEPG